MEQNNSNIILSTTCHLWVQRAYNVKISASETELKHRYCHYHHYQY